jgi:hypothetical protein
MRGSRVTFGVLVPTDMTSLWLNLETERKRHLCGIDHSFVRVPINYAMVGALRWYWQLGREEKNILGSQQLFGLPCVTMARKTSDPQVMYIWGSGFRRPPHALDHQPILRGVLHMHTIRTRFE